jgi:lysophospholipase L1-like esterase
MVKPYKLFLILLLLVGILAVPCFFVPNGGYKVAGFTLKFPSVYQLFDLNEDTLSTSYSLDPELAHLDFLIDSISYNFSFFNVDSFSQKDDSTMMLFTDSTETQPEKGDEAQSLTTEVLKSRYIPIELPDSTFEALKPFFLALESNLTGKQLVRVLHFGDSQIEGDRISSFLRARLQKRFGGCGVGLLHAVPHSYQPGSIRQTNSSNWEKILISDLGKGGVGNRFGVLGGYSVFTTKKFFSKGGFGEAWIKFQRIGPKGSTARNFTQCRIFYGHNVEPFLVSLSYKGKTADAEMVAPTKRVSSNLWSVPASQNIFTIDIKGDESPMVYGISLESKTGIVVDNIPLRGSSGTDFTRSDDATLKQFMQLLNVRLIILQFGVNLVPHIVDSYKFYENQLYNQIVALKRVNPKAAVILIGVSDMSRKEGATFVSYPNIAKIRDAQRNAAFRAGAAFWDCFQAMGGENSMPAWVFANPPLASKDFVHFSLRGSNLIAEMFYSSLMAEYDRYLAGNMANNQLTLNEESNTRNE